MVGSSHDAEDLVQDTFLRICKNGVDEDRSPRNLMFLTGRRLAINAYKRTSKIATDPVADFEFLGLHDDSPSAEEQVISREEFQVLCDAINILPEKCRRVYTLRKIHDLSHLEIAENMGIAVSTVEKHLRKGIKLVTAYYEANLNGISEVDDG